MGRGDITDWGDRRNMETRVTRHETWNSGKAKAKTIKRAKTTKNNQSKNKT